RIPGQQQHPPQRPLRGRLAEDDGDQTNTNRQEESAQQLEGQYVGNDAVPTQSGYPSSQYLPDGSIGRRGATPGQVGIKGVISKLFSHSTEGVSPINTQDAAMH